MANPLDGKNGKPSPTRKEDHEKYVKLRKISRAGSAFEEGDLGTSAKSGDDGDLVKEKYSFENEKFAIKGFMM